MYQPYVVLNGKEFQVETEDDCLFTEQEAMDFVSEMRKADYVDSILTTEGFIGYSVKNVESVYYLCKKVN